MLEGEIKPIEGNKKVFFVNTYIAFTVFIDFEKSGLSHAYVKMCTFLYIFYHLLLFFIHFGPPSMYPYPSIPIHIAICIHI